jgi:hypothetical protein
MVDCKMSFKVSAGISRSIWYLLVDRRACAIARKAAALLLEAAVMVGILLRILVIMYGINELVRKLRWPLSIVGRWREMMFSFVLHESVPCGRGGSIMLHASLQRDVIIIVVVVFLFFVLPCGSSL